ncbi:hypothetical protein K488DRAFT_49506, partial [Vararia minispora EC-137]
MALPFALRVVWFILALLAIPGSWIALVPFARAANVYWAPMAYGAAATVMEGIFCLGIIWNMDSVKMPRSFCWAQTIIFAVCTYILTGICTCLAWATYTTVVRPNYHANDGRQRYNTPLLVWRDAYIIPSVVFPLAASGVFTWVVIRLDAAKPSEGMYCDPTSPLWPRVLSYAGAPLLLAIPSFALSTLTALRIMRVESTARR